MLVVFVLCAFHGILDTGEIPVGSFECESVCKAFVCYLYDIGFKMLAATIKNLLPRMKLKLAKPKITNLAFRMHYQLTVALLLTGTMLVCARELFGDHIKCFTEPVETEKYGKWISNYCFNMATFTVEKLYDESKLQDKAPPNYKLLTRFRMPTDHESFREIPHPGVGPFNPYKDKTLQHNFYQWVPFMLFVQAICFYLPYYVWKNKEGGRIKALVDGLQYAAISGDKDIAINKLNIPSKKTLDNKLNIIKKDILLRLRVNRTWSMWLVAMEVVNLAQVIFQIWAVDSFLGGKFLALGPSVVNFRNWSTAMVTPLEPIFPKVTKCIYHKYGASGTIISRDVLCVMALNVIHEKIFVALWFWFLALFIVSLAAVIWRLTSYVLYRQSAQFSQEMFYRASSARLEPNHVASVVRGCQFGDWLFLYYLAKNMNAIAFPKLLKLVAEELGEKELVDSLGYKIGFEPMCAENYAYHDDSAVDLKNEKKA